MSEPAPPGRVGAARWAAAILALVVGLSHIAFATTLPGPKGLNDDGGIQYWLSRLTAEGAVPLVDFQHGWNAGSWWVTSLMYRLGGGDPNAFDLLHQTVFGSALGLVVVVAVAVSLRWSPAVTGLAALVVVALTSPPHFKYVLPLLWVILLLPGRRRSEGTAGLVCRGIAAAVLFWLHVELALLLAAGTGLYDLLGVRRLDVRQRLARIAASGAGLAVGVVTELGFYATHGLSPAEVNRQVFLGQAREFPRHFGWDLLGPDSWAMALYPMLLLLPFVPLLWRQLREPGRFFALCALALALTAIRRPGPGHVVVVSTLFPLTLGALATDLVGSLKASVPRFGLVALAKGVGGAAWVAIVLLVGFTVGSLFAIVLLLLAVAATMALGERHASVEASLGAIAALCVLVAVGTTQNLAERIRASDPLAQARIDAAALDSELDRCLGDDRTALVMPNTLPLYDAAQLENPTNHYKFHYDFDRHRDEIERGFESAEIPAVVLAPAIVPPYLPWFTDSLVEHYTRCSKVNIIETNDTIDLWVHSSRAPSRQRLINVNPDGSILERDLAESPPPEKS